MLNVDRPHVFLSVTHDKGHGSRIGQLIYNRAERATKRVKAKIANLAFLAPFIEPDTKAVASVGNHRRTVGGIEQQTGGVGFEFLQGGDCLGPQRNPTFCACLGAIVVQYTGNNPVAFDHRDFLVAKPAVDTQQNRGSQHQVLSSKQNANLCWRVHSPGAFGCVDSLFLFAGLLERRAVSHRLQPSLLDGEVEQRADAHHKLLTPTDGLTDKGSGKARKIFGRQICNHPTLANMGHELGQDVGVVTHRLETNGVAFPRIEGITDIAEGNRVSGGPILKHFGKAFRKHLVGVQCVRRCIEAAYPSRRFVYPSIPPAIRCSQAKRTLTTINFVTHFVTHFLESTGFSGIFHRMSTDFKTVAYTNSATPGKHGFPYKNSTNAHEINDTGTTIPCPRNPAKSLEVPDELLRTCYARLLEKLEQVGECYEYTGARVHNGYGVAWNGRKVMVAHRFVYVMEVGDIPDGMQLDHLCKNRACCNPAHLEAVTSTENNRRSARTKLNQDQVAEIRELAGRGLLHREIAPQFGLSKGSISAIVRGKCWRDSLSPRSAVQK